MKRTPLHDVYAGYPGVKMIDFAGWELPLQFQAGILAEHRSVREAAGLFDVSHMGELFVEGKGSAEALDWLVTNDVRGMAVGQALYTPMCSPDGGTIDDLLIYRLGAERFMLVVNAANVDKDFAWIDSQSARVRSAGERVGAGLDEGIRGQAPIVTAVPGERPTVTDRSSEFALLAFQGPRALEWLQPLTPTDLGGIAPFHFAEGVRIAGVEVILSRTGYTGEDGFELFAAAADAAELWRALLEATAPRGALPCGLGSRDSLRVEARLPLYGQELDTAIGPLEAGLQRFVKLEKGEFCGRSALCAQRERGVRRALRGCEMIDRGVPRHGYLVYADRDAIGLVTSGERSPTLDRFIALVLIAREHAEIGGEVQIEFSGKRKRARIVPTPFYKRR